MTAIANLPDLRPSLLLDFANSGRVDPRIQCTRASSATCFGPDGKLRTVAANVPRIDYDPATGKCLGLLVEEGRTNLATSSRLTPKSTGTDIGTVTTIAPDGLPIEMTIEGSTTGEHYVQDKILPNLVAGDTITQSIFVKKISETSKRSVVLRVANTNDNGQVRFDIVGDSIQTSAVPPNWAVGFKRCAGGWFRVWASYTATAPNASSVFRVQMQNNGVASYPGDPSEGLFLYGRQLEVGAFPTSYIPTEASAVTRAADTAQLQVAQTAGQWLNASQGTLLARSRAFQSKRKQTTIAALTDGSPANRVILRGDTQLSNGVGGFVVANSVDLLPPAYTPLQPTTGVSVAVSYATNSAAISAYGALLNTSFSGQHPQGIDRLVLGNAPNTGSAEHFNGHISLVAYYPVRITNEQLQRLTA
jgi:hypothetical protein